MILARVDSVALRKLIDPDVAFFIYFGRGCRGRDRERLKRLFRKIQTANRNRFQRLELALKV
jgi:hypothetical protein